MKLPNIARIVGIMAGVTILSLLAILVITSNAIPERIVAKTIPRYPSASAWNISGNVDLYGNPSATIYFETEDLPREVTTFYEEALPKLGITFIEEGKLYNLDGESGDFLARFEKGKYSIFFSSRYYNPLPSGYNYYFEIDN